MSQTKPPYELFHGVPPEKVRPVNGKAKPGFIEDIHRARRKAQNRLALGAILAVFGVLAFAAAYYLFAAGGGPAKLHAVVVYRNNTVVVLNRDEAAWHHLAVVVNNEYVANLDEVQPGKVVMFASYHFMNNEGYLFQPAVTPLRRVVLTADEGILLFTPGK